MKERKLNNKGFSLVELIIVIAIMVILVVVIAPQYTRFVNNSRISADVQTAQTMATAIDAAVADGKTPFTSGFGVVTGMENTLPTTKLSGGTFAISGNDTEGVSQVTIKIGSDVYECYPNPDNTTNGVNAKLKK
ncbi:prepilin-type N-terminal cleavage/methylation domain-containing protein [Lachnospiraceae bacterium YSD2013]|nr:prepilin-type N-terminal cleavage/methylation domain-containing protein [Lachnospiraceae bacterium YSD2013]